MTTTPEQRATQLARITRLEQRVATVSAACLTTLPVGALVGIAQTDWRPAAAGVVLAITGLAGSHLTTGAAARLRRQITEGTQS